MIQKLKSDLKRLFKIMSFLSNNYVNRDTQFFRRQTTTTPHEQGLDEPNSINIAESRAGGSGT